ncbi:ribonuclease P protein component [bacterium]|nr:ribonuclease P protein component [bacterium]
MLPKENRLHQDKEIKAVVQKGQTFFLPQFVIKYQVNKEKFTKIGFIISTKVDKKAVVRNRLARQLREVIRSFLPEMKTGYSVMIIAKKQALELDFEALKKQMAFAFAKIKIYPDKFRKAGS